MTSDMIWQILRYILLAGGGYFVNKGILTNDALTSIIGAIGVLFTAGWGIYVKAGTKAVAADTPAVASGAIPTVSAATGAQQ